jgi:hypothetical protein
VMGQVDDPLGECDDSKLPEVEQNDTSVELNSFGLARPLARHCAAWKMPRREVRV